MQSGVEAMSSDTHSATYQLKVTLRNSNPAIWRRLLVPASMNLEDLHHTLQIVMGWENEHLHEFLHGKRRYGMADVEFEEDILDELEYGVGDLLSKERDALTYLYDFGDSWEHEVLLEKVLPAQVDAELPSCTDGAGACPPEDVGGVYGYERLLEILHQPDHEEYEEALEWTGEDFDPRRFDKEEINTALRHFPDLDMDEIFAGIGEELAAIAEPLSERESELITRYFPVQGRVGDGRPTYPGLQGFVSAIVCAPLPAFPGEWIEVLLDTYEIEVSDESEMQELIVALLKFSNQLADAFDEERPVFPAPYDVDTTPQGTSAMELWCDGFLHGFYFNEDDWFDLGSEEAIEELESFVEIIATLARREFDDQGLAASEFRGKIDQVHAELPSAVIALYNLARSELYMHLDEAFYGEMDLDMRQPAVSNKVGRNEPCPCGSGKKYKKCCIDKPITLH
jgi:yecA family protein